MLKQQANSKIEELQATKEITGILAVNDRQGLKTFTSAQNAGVGTRVNRRFIREITAIKTVKKKPIMADVVR